MISHIVRDNPTTFSLTPKTIKKIFGDIKISPLITFILKLYGYF